MGALCAYELYSRSSRDRYEEDEKVTELVLQQADKLLLWGEAAIPFYYMAARYLEGVGHAGPAQRVLYRLFRTVVKNNDLRSPGGLPTPYYSAEEIIETAMRLAEDPIDMRDFAGGAYLLESLMFALARRGLREFLTENWRAYSHVMTEELIPDESIDNLSYHVEKGLNQSRYPEQTQSWAKLLEESETRNPLPKELVSVSNFLWLLVLVYPHRAARFIDFLDRSLRDNPTRLEVT
jgi:hypothetical protein